MERNFYLAFASVNGVGPKSFAKLLDHFGSAKLAWNAAESELEPVLKP